MSVSSFINHTHNSAHHSMLPSKSRGLSDLPSEVLENIFSDLCPHCVRFDRNEEKQNAWNALNALCKTSRRLLIVAQPIRYHFIQESRDFAFAPLVRTLRNRPDLANSIRQLVDDPWTSYHVNNAGELELLKQVSQDLQLGDLSHVHFDYMQSHDWICSQILMAMAPNLTTLRLSIGNEGENYDDFLDYRGDGDVVEASHFQMLEDRFRSLPGAGFPNLRHVQIESDWEWGFVISRRTIGTILEASPNLEQLIFKRNRALLPMPEHLPSTVARFSGLARVRALEFQACAFEDDELSLEFLGGMVKRCSKLEHFRICSQGPYIGESLYLHFPAPRVLQILMPHRAWLKSLDINLLDSGDILDIQLWNESDVFVDPALLLQFRSLETLKLGDESFCIHRRHPEQRSWTCLSNALPQSIQTLVIRLVDGSHAWNDLAELVEQARAGRFPNLRQVTVYAISYMMRRGLPEFRRRIQQGREQLQENCEQAGILLSVEEQDEPEYASQDDVLGTI